MKKTTSKTTRPYTKEDPFRFRMFASNGQGPEYDRNRPVRRLSYPKHPRDWTGVDLVKVVRLSLAAAHKARGKKPTRGEPVLWIEGLDGFMQITAMQSVGVWAVIPPQFNIPEKAIASVIAAGGRPSVVHTTLPQLLPRDRKTQVRANSQLAKLMKQVQEHIDAEERRVS